jgi:predicted phosphoadenosine phosphosulfate sulfurtransferase
MRKKNKKTLFKDLLKVLFYLDFSCKYFSFSPAELRSSDKNTAWTVERPERT